MKRREAIDSLVVGSAIESTLVPNYLGNAKAVTNLLRSFAARMMMTDFTNGQALVNAVDKAARRLAKVFLGQDPKFPGPKWNTPGQIDTYLAKWCGVDSQDPVERVAGALVDMMTELYQLSSDVEAQKLIKEQWQGAAGAVIKKYTALFLGLPVGVPYD
jgi:hypothetical protein